MSRYLLDTTALIDLSKGRERAVSAIREWIAAGDELLVCAVQVAEFYRGIRPADRENWDTFFGTLTYLDISRQAARHAGIVRYEFDRRGLPLQLTDTLLATAAIAEGATLVTNNIRHYEPIEGVRLQRLSVGTE